MKHRWQFWVLWAFLSMLWVPRAWAQLPGLPANGAAADLPSLRFLPDAASRQQNVAELQSLFYREPWVFGPETFTGLWEDIQRLPWLGQTLLNNLSTFWRESLWLGLGLALLLLLGVFVWVDRRFRQLPNHLLPLMSQSWPFWLRRLVKVCLVVLARLGLGLCLLFAVHLLWGAVRFEQRWFPLLVNLLWVGLLYRGVQTWLDESLIQERETFFRAIPEHITDRLYGRLNGFALYAAFFWVMIFAFRDLGYRTDFVEFLQFGFYASLLLFASFLIARKADVFSLFPDIDEPIYQRFLIFFQRFYLWVAGFTLLLGLLWIAGYRQLAETLFLRSWAIVGWVLLLRLLQRFCKRLLLTHLSGPGSGESRLLPAVLKLLLLLEALVVIHGVLALLDMRQPVLRLLSQPLASIGEQSVISVLSFINGLLTLVFFFLSTQIVIAFLEERVFPKLNTGVHQMIAMSIFYSLMGLGSLVALNVIGIDLSVFAIFAGALAFGIGFGLQGIAKNFASGVVLIFTQLVKKGDYITVGEHMGYIQDVSWKRVLLRTPDAVDLIIPTVDLIESKIINWSYSSQQVRVHLPVRVAYDADLEIVKQALLEAASQHAEVLMQPPPDVWLKAFGLSALELELLVWVNCLTISQDRLIGELNFMIWQSFQKHNIRIPFPQQELHLRSGCDKTPS